MRNIAKVLVLLCLTSYEIAAQSVLFGANNYVEYQIGTLPIIISVAHGGVLQPANIPDRTCNSPVLIADAFTIETAMEIKNALFAQTGCYPHLIISHLKRNKLDCNRNVTDGGCGNTTAITAWNEFHNFIDTARTAANQQFNNNTFFVDLHGHGNPIQRIELGYLLYSNELELADTVLNTTQYINYSAIKSLALNNLNNYTHSQLLRGTKSLGTLLSERGYPAVPSQTIPFPGTNNNYFNGGYITANHTSYAAGINISGLQMELNFTGIRDSQANRIQFANAFSLATIGYLNTHFNINWIPCVLLSAKEIDNKDLIIFPNPVKKGISVRILNLESKSFYFKLYDVLGAELKVGKLTATGGEISTTGLTSGLYFLKLYNSEKKVEKVVKLIVE
jgi:hypothetical protein